LATVLAAGGAAWAWALLGMTFAARMVLAFAASVLVLDDPQFFRNVFLLPLRDVIAPLVWAASFMGNSIQWRGENLTLKDGRLIRS
jgi:hypothetical protein